ncbi:MAG TPA: CopD family protein [Bradyrhizobium sp.]|uniref:copper resistance CopC/CopD family protein n=1 Tax=Bradyrhizobium sp. TaxID=376 RepID=UPI002C00900E|nr:CopD family protein [Bradyrhizobium sp.]HTB00001.1 CopD family protein [Bradyrhizobium sp.]
MAGTGRPAAAETLTAQTSRLIAGLATLLIGLCLATGAFAHASLVFAEPADGSVLSTQPKVVELRFNEAVTPAVINLIDAAGRVRGDAIVHAAGEAIVIDVPQNLPRGTQVVSYRVISADGHPVGGSMLFSIGTVTTAAKIPKNDGTVDVLIWLARTGVYLGLFAGVGGVFFVTWIGKMRAGAGVINAALTVGLASAAASLGLQGLDALDIPLHDLSLAAPWQAAFATSLGPSLLIAAVAMVAAIVALQAQSVGTARALSALALAGVGLSLATTGHAAAAPPQWTTRPAVFLHGVGVAFWIGALAPLAAMVRRPGKGLIAVVIRFSRIAVAVVGVLVLTGFALAVVQLQSFGALIETKYGIILSIKLALVMVLLGLAALNRFRLTPALAFEPLNTRPLWRSILTECVVVLAILAVVAGWRFTPPPRALAAAITPLALHIHTDDAMFQVLVSPGTVGADSFVLQLMNGDASPLAAKEATLTLSLPERGIEPMERAATLGPDGYWHVREVLLPYPGRWHLRIDALVTDFQKITLEDDIDVPAP